MKKIQTSLQDAIVVLTLWWAGSSALVPDITKTKTKLYWRINVIFFKLNFFRKYLGKSSLQSWMKPNGFIYLFLQP